MLQCVVLTTNTTCMTYETRSFTIPALAGISENTIKEHLGLYAGYVKHVNLIHEKIAELSSDPEKNAYALTEIRRRLGFEWGGMKNHECYFAQFEEGAHPLPEGPLKAKLEASFGDIPTWIQSFKQIAMTRGVGWAMLCYDKKTDSLITTWVDEQHLGQLIETEIILALDMWEHSYVADYQPSGKKQYVEDFLANLNWEVVEENFKNAQ